MNPNAYWPKSSYESATLPTADPKVEFRIDEKIPEIKWLRRNYPGLGLREAKQMVDARHAQQTFRNAVQLAIKDATDKYVGPSALHSILNDISNRIQL